MVILSAIKRVFRRNLSDVLGIDVGASSTKVVRIKSLNGSPTVIAAGVLAPIDLKAPPSSSSFSSILTKPFKARYAALSVSGNGSLVKLLTFPVNTGKSKDEQILELMGLGNHADFRIAYEPVLETRGELKVLAVALPDAVARSLCGLCPVGIPAPCSLEISGLASLTAYQGGPGSLHKDDCVAVIECGASVTLVAIYFKRSLVLIRLFDFGVNNILKKLQDNLGVDADVAEGILSDGSFDVSKIVHQAMEGFLQQLIISWDYIERRENTRVGTLYVCGGGALLRLWGEEIEGATGKKISLWDPFEGLSIQDGAIPEQLKGQAARFAGAVGAAMGVLRA